MRGKFSLTVVVCLFLVSILKAQNFLAVNESETQVILHEETAQISFVIDNPQKRFDGRISLELLDTGGVVRTRIEKEKRIESGRATYQINLPLLDLMRKNADEIAWFRLRFRIADANGKQHGEGVISLSEVIKDAFELRVTASENVFSGMNYRARIRAFQPFTNEPVKKVKIKGELNLDLDVEDDAKTETEEHKLKISAKGESDAEGFAVLNFKIPQNVKFDYSGELKITGAKYGIVREIEEDLETSAENISVYLNADKPLYQPGQIFNARGIALKTGNEQNTVVADAELEFVIKDEENTLLYRETVRTSRFGVASVSWQIPENAKLGSYRIQVEDENGNGAAYENFKVSRYDLPNFTVSARADRNFYLPAQTTANVEIRAEYLFGKPLAKGKVRVVEETERRWNYQRQKYDIKEARAFEGETDADGKFTAQIDLTEAHAELGRRGYRRYEDLNFAAYYTDATTNRTEQRRFDLRLTKEAVHVYLIGDTYNRNPDLPLLFYVSTFYADGSAARCAVEVKGKYENESAAGKSLAQIRTNRYGAGKLEFNAPPNKFHEKDLQLEIRVADEQGNAGTHEEEIDFGADERLQIRAEKTIYKTGEAIHAEIVSTNKDAFVYVDVVKDWSVVDSRFVRLKNGRGEIKIPYQANFKNDLVIAAYAETVDKEDGDVRLVTATRGVIYPAPQNLKLNAEFSQMIYRPNEEARINFSVLSADETPLESALGIIVFDKAIEERARTDADFGGANTNLFKNYGGLLGDGDGFGSLSRRDFDELDLSKPVSGDLQLAAEVMLHDSYYRPHIYQSDNFTQARSVYNDFFEKQLAPVEEKLKKQYNQDFQHPTNDDFLREILAKNAIDFQNLRDPWSVNYRVKYEIEKADDLMTLTTAGADKKFDTKDDFTVLRMSFNYFLPVGRAIDRAVANYHGRTNSFIRDYAALRGELQNQNVDLDNLRDRWNRQYRTEFEVKQRKFLVRLQSVGADGIRQTDGWSRDDFDVWTSEIDYFAETENGIQAILSNYVRTTKLFPNDAKGFWRVLKENKIDSAQIRDGYDRIAYLTHNVYSRVADRVKTETVVKAGAKPSPKTTAEPVARQIVSFKLRSAGADAVEGTADDFDLASFSGVVSEQGKSVEKPKNPLTIAAASGAKGAIRGTITDPMGAVVPGATVTATNAEAEEEFSAASNEEGVYLMENLPPGKYKIAANASGFSEAVLSDFSVRATNITEADFTLNAGGVEMTVEVTSQGVTTLETTSTQIASGVGYGSGNGMGSGTGEAEKNVSENKLRDEKTTPRLREYFPETLVWQPELVTEKNGKAELKFKLGDNITTWKLYAIASDAQGRIGIAEREIKAFQPFFADLEPPKFLTVGDEIFLPVQIRNYTDAKQTVQVTLGKSDWFNFLDAANKQIEVAPNDSENAVFGFRADTPIESGKQRVTAIADKDSDAIEKPITVRPNGKEVVQTKSGIFRESIFFDAHFPANALPNTPKTELKIYPNLLAHVAESIEGLLQRPYGCGEQTISSTYPNLMTLKFADGGAAAGQSDGEKSDDATMRQRDNEKNIASSQSPKVTASVRQKAENFLRKGYERLLGYQQADGGFSVWAKDAPDVALTAYALRFLTDAKDYTAVDEDAIKRARAWLITQQRADGSWTRRYYGEKTEDSRQTKLMTTYAVRTLAMTEKDAKEKSGDARIALRRGLEYLKTRGGEIVEPYALALFGLASLDAGNFDDANAAAAKLEPLAIRENAGAYWTLEANTPFYGWGTAGRIETTALVVQLFLKVQNSKFKVPSQSESPISNLKSQNERQTENLISEGTQFLLKNKDRYGVWYSTQTTVNVLDALLAAVGDEEIKTAEANRTAEVFINKQKLKDVALPPENSLAFPITVDVPTTANANRIEIKINGNQNSTMAQIVQTHYIPWQDYEANGRAENASRSLRLGYVCDKQTAKPTEEISCRVEAERVGFKGYGMLLAEIGLPPGAEVDRASLEKAKDENWNFSRYDVLPDRIIVYLWAQAGGVKFNFKFKPRYGINAQTAPSIIYDYYNAEAQATVAPLKFSVK